MKVQNKKWIVFILISILICISCSLFASCSSTAPDPVTDDQAAADCLAQMQEESGAAIENFSAKKEKPVNKTAKSEESIYTVSYQIGDIKFTSKKDMTYEYYTPLGWKLKSVSDTEKNEWTRENKNPVVTERILNDLQNASYFSNYSNGLMDKNRVLETKIIEQSTDLNVGYDRFKLNIVLNADDVHENITVNCEYLLNEQLVWELLAYDLTLESVSVQKGVSDDVITEAVKSIRFYRNQEGTTWRFSDMNKLSYEISERSLDIEESLETIKISFRAEGTYMFVTGTATLIFRFSSGWYLYETDLKEDDFTTGFLADTWNIDENQLILTLTETQKLSYGNTKDVPYEKSNIKDMKITDLVIQDSGQFQTAYFSYQYDIGVASLVITGYGKYEIVNGALKLSTWNESISNIAYHFEGSWYGCSSGNEGILYEQLSIGKCGDGVFYGNLTYYGILRNSDAAGNENAGTYLEGSNGFSGNIEQDGTMEFFFSNENAPVFQYFLNSDGTFDFSNKTILIGSEEKTTLFTNVMSNRPSQETIKEAVKKQDFDSFLTGSDINSSKKETKK